MFSSLQKDIIKKISSRKIKNSFDFLIHFIECEPFNEELLDEKFENPYLIYDFQDALYYFSEFITTIKFLQKHKFIRLVNSADARFTIIQPSHLSKKFEKSMPIHTLLIELIEENIVLTDHKKLKCFIRSKFLSPSELRELVLKWLHIILVIITIFLSIFSLVYQIKSQNATLSMISKLSTENSLFKQDTLNVKISQESIHEYFMMHNEQSDSLK